MKRIVRWFESEPSRVWYGSAFLFLLVVFLCSVLLGAIRAGMLS